MLKVFFDTSVLFSAIYSSTGGSYQICQLVRQGKIKGLTSQTVVKELLANTSKFSKKTEILPEEFIVVHKLIVRNEISEQEIKLYRTIISAKDAHILAGATLCCCDYLLTLDKKHLDNEGVKDKFTFVIITSPKEFLEYFRAMFG